MARTRVLHVDDDEDIRFLVELVIGAAADLELVSYASGAEALAGARREPPGVALIDVMMPEMDGMALASAFRQEPALREVPVIFVTARAELDEIADLRQAGAEILVKPFDLAELERLVRSLLPRP